MPNILSSIPGLSALPSIPNPINLFTDDTRPLSSILRSNSTPNGTPKAGADEDPDTPADRDPNHLAPPEPSTPTPGTLSSKRLQIADPRASAITIASDAGGESDTGGPRTALQRSDTGRRRGLSVSSAMTGVSGVSGMDRRRRRVETFVLVKPPPTSGKNPLNLQVQLVVPTRNPTGRPRKGSNPDSMRIPSGSSTGTSATAAETANALAGGDSSAASTPARCSLEDTCPPAMNPESDNDTPLAQPSTGGKLKRSGSLNSTKSSTSGASLPGSGASGKRIIPLYNLAVHNVMQPTLVTDAGTDSKVAKYMKKYLDISGVGILEPTEVWLVPAGGVSGSSPRPSFNLQQRPNRPASMISNMSNLTPASSRIDIDSQRTSTDTKASAREAPREDGAKKFFGKIFRKRTSAEPLLTSKMSSASASFLAVDQSAIRSPTTPASPSLQPLGGDVVPVGTSASATFSLAPAVLHRQTAEISLDESGAIIGLTKDEVFDGQDTVALSRSRRPIGYSWTVRKWAKKRTEGWAAHLVAAAAAGLELVAGALPADGEDEVIFEWVKLRVSPVNAASAAALRRHPAADALDPSRLRRRRRATTLALPSPAGSRQGSKTSLVEKDGAPATPLQPTLSRRSSTLPTPEPPRRPSGGASASASDAESELGPRVTRDSRPSTPLLHVDDDEYDSDPEDSETPWACSVYVKHTGQRQLLATLTPAPHHPKVIGVLKIPQNLRSVSLANVGTLASASAQNGANGTELAHRVGEEVCLTEENLKDVVSVTAMWLVAREEFGGLGRQKKAKK